jgi:hypothetical protein
LNTQPQPSFVRTWLGGVAVIAVLVWQATLAVSRGIVDVTSAGTARRLRLFQASEAERIEETLGAWAPLHSALRSCVPEDATVYTVLPREFEVGARWYQLVALLYPRRFIPLVVDPGQDLEPALKTVGQARETQGLWILDLGSKEPPPYERWCRPIRRVGPWSLWQVEGPR